VSDVNNSVFLTLDADKQAPQLLTTAMDDLVNIKSPPSTSLVSTETATATDMTFSQALNDTTGVDEVRRAKHTRRN